MKLPCFFTAAVLLFIASIVLQPVMPLAFKHAREVVRQLVAPKPTYSLHQIIYIGCEAQRNSCGALR